MKKSILFLLAGIFCSTVSSFAQQGLENIIVETYYISDANDTMVNADGGVLPVGSVTYRIYADMLPGYRFQAAYGVPDHELRIETSTLFFNNEDRGSTSPTYTKTHAEGNTVMLDSWLSVGAGCAGNFGILKSNDNGVATVVNDDAVLQNNSAALGTPLTMEDGLIAGTPEPVTTVGISTEIAMLDNQNDGTNGPVFSTYNGSWASLNGSIGPDSVTNHVLIAQITTDGVFSFKLNIQIGTPSLGVENYVAENPLANEILFAPLNYTTSGIADVNAPSFLLFPNPVSDILKVKLFNITSDEVSVRIMDIKGSVVISEIYNNASANQVLTADVSSLMPGLYIIETSVNGLKSAAKFIRQ